MPMQQPALQRIAVLGRGESAARFVRTAREWAMAQQRELRTVALHAPGDTRSLFVREADEVCTLAAPWLTGEGTLEAPRLAASVDLGVIEPALREARADALWAGWELEPAYGALAQLCKRLGLTFLGASVEAIARAADEAGLRRLCERLALPWATVEQVGAAGARRIAVLVASDHAATGWALGACDVTLQPQGVAQLVEAPPPALPPSLRDALSSAALRLVGELGAIDLGAVEFICQPEPERWGLHRVQLGLPEIHGAVEATSGLDLIKLQLDLAAGRRLEGEPPPAAGCALEVRLHADALLDGALASGGPLHTLRLPFGTGVSLEAGYAVGDLVPGGPAADVVRLVTTGLRREQALARMERALRDTAVVVGEGASNQGLLLGLLAQPEVVAGRADGPWLERWVASRGAEVAPDAAVALVFAAVAAYRAELAAERMHFYVTAAHGRPELDEEVGRAIELSLGGESYRLRLRRVGPLSYRAYVNGLRIEFELEDLEPSVHRVLCAGRRYRIVAGAHGPAQVVLVNGVPHRVQGDRGGVVRAPAPAVVASVGVKEGDEVAIGDRLAVLEAMKTETALLARFAGRVRRVLVINNGQVAAGAPLFVIEPPATSSTAFGPGVRLRFDDLGVREAEGDGEGAAARQLLAELRALVLGFDADAARLRQAVAEHGVLTPGLPAADAEVLRLEDELLGVFVDLRSLFRRKGLDRHEDEETRQSATEYLLTYLREIDAQGESLPADFVERLQGALVHYGVRQLERSLALEEALFRIFKAQQRLDDQLTPVFSVLQRRLDRRDELAPMVGAGFRAVLDRLIVETQGRFPTLNDLAHEVRYRYFDQPVLEQNRTRVQAEAARQVAALARLPAGQADEAAMQALVEVPQPLTRLLFDPSAEDGSSQQRVMLELLLRRHYRIRPLERVRLLQHEHGPVVAAEYPYEGQRIQVLSACSEPARLASTLRTLVALSAGCGAGEAYALEIYCRRQDPIADVGQLGEELLALVQRLEPGRPLRRIVIGVSHAGEESRIEYFTFRQGPGGFAEDKLYRGLHPMIGKRLQLWRLSNFEIERLPSVEEIYLYRATARDNPKDERLFALAEVRDLTAVRDAQGRVERLPELERLLFEALASIRRVQAQRAPQQRLHWNRVQLFVWPVFELRAEELNAVVHRLAPATAGLGLERVLVRARMPEAESLELRDRVLDIAKRGGAGVTVRFRDPPTAPMQPVTEYVQKVVSLRQRGLLYPYELIEMLTPAREGVQAEYPPGEFLEHDLDAEGRLVPVERPYGLNKANIVVGLLRHFTARYPEGMTRVALFGDPSRGMGALAEPECRRINAALALAQQLGVPLEWFAVSAGAKISMSSGVENMDWISLVLRRLIEFTQAGGEVNVVVMGINVGAQPYWNAEATMLMHTRGILIMTAQGSMVLTGKRALDYSGGVSAADNEGIGGYDHIMGPNGQAQYFAADVHEACQLLLRYYEHSYVAPGERFPRRGASSDAAERDVRSYPHGRIDGTSFLTVGEVFSDEHNPGRKKPFDIRRVMHAVVDQDDQPLERWYNMRDAETSVVWDACLGGYPVCLLGLESRPLPRLGFVPADGPRRWTAGTLFPQSSKKVARAINSVGGRRPLVVLANLSGFDGSPESMRNVQLEYGAEIGRAVVNFRGPIVFAVISRYHGGAFVVFSNQLNERIEVAALQGTHASVIGGAPAAAVVFSRDVEKRTRDDARVRELERQCRAAEGVEKVRLRARLDALMRVVESEKLGEVAEEYDRVHDIFRAQKMGSVHHIIAPERLRPYLVEAIERGVQRELGQVAAAADRS
ncbi:MAG: carbamoyl-phosphate synthase subunit L [Proteobacteria bacterium]|nr:carbamoyl-phosphate synthase subunit L [Pseudomonadota bacterium]